LPLICYLWYIMLVETWTAGSCWTLLPHPDDRWIETVNCDVTNSDWVMTAAVLVPMNKIIM
jgi:hypothetical protein